MGHISLNLTQPLKTRFAPTPSGYLHFGNLVNFSLTWAMAKKYNAKVMLRIDDLDQERFRSEYLEDIFRVLEDLGFEWDEGPSGPDDFLKNWSQNHRLDQYRHLLAKVWETSKLFVCECTRKNYDSALGYPGTCLRKNLSYREGIHQLRLNTHGVFDWALQDESPWNFYKSDMTPYPVLLQKNSKPSYQIASLSDDLRWGVNLIVRGEDLYPSSLVQHYLKEKVLGLKEPAWCFMHHGLVRMDKQKLSKSSGNQAHSLREDSRWRQKLNSYLKLYINNA